MPVEYSRESAYAKERCKWEATHTEFGPPGKPWKFQEYPVMLYRATHPPAGGPPRIEQEIAADEGHERILTGRGFVRGSDHAVERLAAQDVEFAKLAAEREYEKRRMSAQAVAEAERVEDATSNHLPTIPERPIRRRRPKQTLTDEQRAAVGARLKAARAAKRESTP
jgi:hypothetical protein